MRIAQLVPLRFRHAVRDTQQRLARHFAGRPRGIERLGLAATQVYPYGENFYEVLLASTEKRLGDVHLTAQTPVASIGTCFAEEFASFMLRQGYNYLRAEEDVLAASANWGRVYTIPNLHQIVRYSLEDDFAIQCEHGPDGWFDPMRECAPRSGENRDDAVAEIRRHRAASRRVFAEARFLIITVGQNEAWVDGANELVWAHIPPKDLLDASKDRFAVREFSYDENLSRLEATLTQLFAFNPALRVIITVSPVPSFASFSSFDVITQSFANKCMLRSVVGEVEKRLGARVYYFPSFEAVLCYNPTNFRADNRHVQFGAVGEIFKILAQSTQSSGV